MSHTRFLYHKVFRTKGGEPMIGASLEGESQITAFEDFHADQEKLLRGTTPSAMMTRISVQYE